MLNITKKKVPFKQQMADSDCGASCLAMLLSYHGFNSSVTQVKKDCEKFGPPQSTKSIIAAGREKGLDCKLLSADFDSISSISLPCILHWNFNHFVVLESINSTHFTIVDPAFGRRRVSFEEFDLSFTGIVVSALPNEAFKKNKKVTNDQFKNYLKNSLNKWSIYKALILVISVSLLLQGASLIQPLITLYLVDVVIPTQLVNAMDLLFWFIIALGLNTAIFNYLRSNLIVYLQNELDEALNTGFLNKLLNLPASFFVERSSGDLQNRLNSNNEIRNAVSSFGVTATLDLFVVIGYTVVLAYVSIEFAVLTLALGLTQIIVYLICSSALKEKFTSLIKSQASYHSYLIEILNGIQTLKAAGAEKVVINRWKRKLNNYLISTKEKGLFESNMNAVISSIRVITPALLLWFSAGLYFKESLSLGQLLAVNSISIMIISPLSSLLTTMRQYVVLKANVERISELWLHDEEKEGKSITDDFGSGGSLKIENVYFRYKSSSSPCLKDINLEIPFGSKVGIVGPSGSGKSTLVSLILGFYEPTKGKITYNEIDYSNLDLNKLRKTIGFVPQKTFLFNTTIKSNICLSKPDASLNEIVDKAKIANIHDEIEEFPMGYNSIVGESGVSISGGQRQRIAIARALMAEPKIVILDEATSSLDSLNETSVSNNIMNVDCTQIIISHRLSTIKECDIIYVISDGKIVSKGSHSELLQTNQYYQNCYRQQSQNSFIEEFDESKSFKQSK